MPVLRGSGGSYRPRSVGKPHDFKYEREPQLKAPKEVPGTENPIEDDIEPSIESGPELYKSYELPVKDLELLLAELDANPLETPIEANQKVEDTENAERSL